MNKQKNILRVSIALLLLLLSVATRSYCAGGYATFISVCGFADNHFPDALTSLNHAHRFNFICEDASFDDDYNLHRHKTIRCKGEVLLLSMDTSFEPLLSSWTVIFFSSDTSPPTV